MSNKGEERRAAQLQRLEDAVANLQCADGFQDWLKIRTAFREYSFNNQMLIAIQRPSATRVAGYRKWAELKRQVRKGEKAIKILAPILVKSKTEVDDDGEPVKKMRFREVNVFDVAQTEGEPLPSPPPLEPVLGDSHERFIEKLEAFAVELGGSVSYRRLPRGHQGYCVPATNEIVVDEALAPNARVAVLVHELVHAAGVDYVKFSRAEAEAIAESAAYVVCRGIGLETGQQAAPYIAQYANADERRRVVSAIDHYAAIVERAIGEHERSTSIWEPRLTDRGS